MSKQLSLYLTKQLSLIKWKAAVRGKKTPKRLENIRSYCGFCERHKILFGVNCKNCELRSLIGECTEPGSTYRKYAYAQDKIAKIKAAFVILEAIQSIKTPRPTFYERLRLWTWH
jgi:hypothetical protein